MATDNQTALPIKTLTAGAVSVKIDQTTPGTTNLVQVGGSLPAGTAILGKVGIDQTTPGTTNGVQVNAALPTGANTIGNVGLVAGSAIVGKFGIDQTTPGTTNGVQITGPGTSGGNPLYVNTGAGATGTLKNSGQLSSLALAALGTATLSAAAVTTAKQGFLQHVVASSATPMKIEIQTVNNSGTATTQITMFSSSSLSTIDWRPNNSSELSTVASADGTNNKFQVKVTNQDSTTGDDVYVYIAWNEV